MTVTAGYLKHRPTSTTNIERLFISLFYLERTPGAEKAAAAVAKQLHKEFINVEEKINSRKEHVKVVAGIKYMPNGVAMLNDGTTWYTVILPAWEPKLATPVVKKTQKKSSRRYTILRHVNPIWYAQVMLYKKRRPSLKNQQIDYLEGQKHLAHYRELDEELQKLVPKSEGSLKQVVHDSIYRLFNLFDINSSVFYRLGINDDKAPKHFFFLNEDECKALITALDTDGIGGQEQFYYEDRLSLTATALEAVVQATPKDRVWVLQTDLDKFTHKETVETNGWMSHTRHIIDYEGVWNYYQEELEDLSEEHLKILKLFNLELQKEVDSEEEEG